jgi:hypothetical protein
LKKLEGPQLLQKFIKSNFKHYRIETEKGERRKKNGAGEEA